jgi:hypothetical protein
MNKNPIVDDYLLKKDHPMTAEIQQVREIILSTDDRIEETIKWSSPTFIYKGNMEDIERKKESLQSLVREWIAMQDED